MNKINVSELSDVELNRAMIWLYPIKGMELHKNGPCFGCDYFLHRQGIGYSWLDYLTDYNLTMPLAVENGLSVDLKCGTIAADKFTHFSNADPLRSICEALVMIRLDK